MPDIVTSKIFVDGEKGITAAKMNQIISGAVIQPDFVSGKPASATLDPTDQMLELKGAGTYATITGSQLVSSVASQVDVTPQITAVRLRSFNSVGNSTFECDMRQAHAALVNPASTTFVCDRWQVQKAGTAAVNVNTGVNLGFGGGIVVPGTSQVITQNVLQLTLTTAQASLGATDFYQIEQAVEGSQMRELSAGVHSISLLVQSTVAPLKFAIALRDNVGATPTRSLVKLCTLPTTAWTLITLPNIPAWASGGTFGITPGTGGYRICICLAAGSSLTAAAADTWQTGNFTGAPGMDNWLSKPITSSIISFAFIQHEPGPNCTTPIDKPFTQNLDECLRYYYKTYDYGTALGTVTAVGAKSFVAPVAGTNAFGPFQFPKPMAKPPGTITFYNTNTGTAGSVRDGGGVDHASAGASTASQNGFLYLTFATATTGAMQVYAQFAADTGW